jgi:hypothetical protein
MMRDPRAFLANLPPLPTLEAFQRHRDLLSSPQSFLSAAAASLRNPGGLMPPTSMSSHMPPFGMSPLQQRPPSQPTTPSSQSSSPVQQNFGGNQQNWSFEEQFKQVRTQTLERRRSNSLFIEKKKFVFVFRTLQYLESLDIKYLRAVIRCFFLLFLYETSFVNI